MWSQILVLAAIVALFAWWLLTPRGRAALALLGRAPFVLLVAVLLWGLVWLLNEADLGALDEPFLTLSKAGFVLMGSGLIQIALHLVASALVVASLARAAGAREARWTRLFPGLALGQVAVGVPMLALVLLIAAAAAIGSFAGLLVVVALMAVLLVFLNVCLARLVARLVASGGALAPAFSRVWRRDPARDQAVLGPVLIRLLMTGAITVIVIIGHTTHTVTHTTERTGNRTTERTDDRTTEFTAYSANVDVQTVATVTCENPWPGKIYASIKQEPPKALVRGAGLLAAFVALVFLAAFVRGKGGPAGSQTPSNSGMEKPSPR